MLPAKPFDIDIVQKAAMIPELTTESASSAISSIPAYFTSRLQAVSEFFAKGSADLKHYNDKEMSVYFRELNKNRVKLHTKAASIDYGVVSRRKTHIMPGMTGDVMLFADNLAAANAIVSGSLRGVLADTKIAIAKLASDKGYRRSSRPVVFDRTYSDDNARLTTLMAALITPKSTTDVVTVSTIAPSIPHIQEAIESVMSFSGVNNIAEFEKIREDVKVIKDYSDALYEEFTKDSVNVRRERVVEVAEYLKASADFVTTAVNVLYLTNQTVGMLNNLVSVVLSKK